MSAGIITLGEIPPGGMVRFWTRPQRGNRPYSRLTGPTVRVELRNAFVRFRGHLLGGGTWLTITRLPENLRNIWLQVQEHGISHGGSQYTVVCTPKGTLVPMASELPIKVMARD